MTKKTASAVRSMAIREIEDQVLSIRTELAKERAAKSSGTRPDNPGKIRKLRRSMARHITILKQKQREVQPQK